MSVIRIPVDTYTARQATITHLFDGTWVNSPNLDTPGWAIIEDESFTPADQTVIDDLDTDTFAKVPPTPKTDAVTKASTTDAKHEALRDWRLSILAAYPDTVAKLEADVVVELDVQPER